MRYAAYVRISSEEQVGNYSLDAQKRAIETWVLAQGGLLVKVYTDEAQSGRTMERPAFQQMRRDARAGKFDALVVHKFDRFARNRTDALAIKSLLRYDYSVKVFSVTEPSEDSDGPMGGLIEGIMESVADWYSQNLATETAKGKKERSIQGFHNNQAPFGMKKGKDGVLVADEKELPGLLMAFEKYATGQYSDADVAHLLHEAGYHSKTGRRFSKETVRSMLQNETYLGKTKYQKYLYKKDGTRLFTSPVERFEGKHDPVISQELFERCQKARARRLTHRQATAKYKPYLLRNLVYCYRCCQNPPSGKPFRDWGKMRCHAQSQGRLLYYGCRARSFSFDCPQRGIQVNVIDQQVVHILKHLEPPKEWRKGITKAVSELLGDRNLEERLTEIQEIIKRMDARWDHGFITNEQDYIRQRVELQQEMERLTPIPDNELEQAVELLENFPTHWERLEGQPEAQSDLIRLLVERVYVEDDRVVALTLPLNLHMVLGHNINGPTTTYMADPFIYTNGSDGFRLSSGHNIFVWAPRSEPHHIFVRLVLRVMCRMRV